MAKRSNGVGLILQVESTSVRPATGAWSSAWFLDYGFLVCGGCARGTPHLAKCTKYHDML